MTDGGEMLTNGLDRFLNEHINGLTIQNRKKINKAGADVYMKNMRSFLDQHRSNNSYISGQEHLADTLTSKNDLTNGQVDVGFSAKGKKAYIARLLNDGWESKNQYGGPYKRVQPPEWHDFFSTVGKESDVEMEREMTKKARKIFNPTGGSAE